MPTYSVEVIKRRLNSRPGRLALFHILKRDDLPAFRRTLILFADHSMTAESAKVMDWKIKAELGTLKFADIRF